MTPGDPRPPRRQPPKRRDTRPAPAPAAPREPREGYLAIGVVLRPHGLRGELRILTESPGAPNLQPGATVHIAGRPYPVLHTRPDKDAWVVQLRGVPTRTAAEALRGDLVEVAEADAAPLEEGAYYVHELIGLRVITETGEVLGEIVDVMQPGANDVYVVDGGPRGEVLIPAIRDVVDSVNVSERVMHITTLPGLLDDSR